MHKLTWKTLRQTKKLLITIVGFAVVLVGIAMVVLPGPAFLVIPLGLGILAREFVWARNLLKKVRMKFRKTRQGGIYGEKDKSTGRRVHRKDGV